MLAYQPFHQDWQYVQVDNGSVQVSWRAPFSAFPQKWHPSPGQTSCGRESGKMMEASAIYPNRCKARPLAERKGLNKCTERYRQLTCVRRSA